MNEIYLPRGTSLTLAVQIFENDSQRAYSDGDSVRLSVKQDVESTSYSIQKNAVYDAENQCYLFTFTPEDTQDLIFDRYWYDIGYQTSDGDFYIVIPMSEFNIIPAVTQKEESL